MHELKVRNNETGLVIYINGIPKLKIMQEDEHERLVSSLEIQMSDYFKSRFHNRKY
ncbi:MAG: hypothetical protein IJ817_01835 [Clostridia bacterium]|nr:hypothetical protein [Clostridia bacterium]